MKVTVERLQGILVVLAVLFVSLPVLAQQQAAPAGQDRGPAPRWKPLVTDGLHDPASPALEMLQEPAEALSILPGDQAGNHVRWVKALADGYINPRTNILPGTAVQVLDLDIIMPRTGEMPMVRFPHRAHTEWLDCANCHDAIFAREAGATPVNMFQILQGNYCGQCHGAVAFPLTECRRCHSVPRKTMGQRP